MFAYYRGNTIGEREPNITHPYNHWLLAFVSSSTFGDTAPRAIPEDPTFTMGLAVLTDPEDPNIEHGRPCILQCKWVEHLSEVNRLIWYDVMFMSGQDGIFTKTLLCIHSLSLVAATLLTSTSPSFWRSPS